MAETIAMEFGDDEQKRLARLCKLAGVRSKGKMIRNAICVYEKLCKARVEEGRRTVILSGKGIAEETVPLTGDEIKTMAANREFLKSIKIQ